MSSGRIKTVPHMKETHSNWKVEVELLSFELLLCNAKHKKLRIMSFGLEQILRPCLLKMSVLVSFNILILLHFFLLPLIFLRCLS